MKKKETKLINEVWHKLAEKLNHQDWTHHADKLLEICLQESKAHDRWRGSSENPRGISITTEAKYFAVKRIYEYMNGHTPPKPEDYLHMQKSCFYAYAIVWDFGGLQGIDRDILGPIMLKHDELFKTVANWDYCDLIKVEDRKQVSEVEA